MPMMTTVGNESSKMMKAGNKTAMNAKTIGKEDGNEGNYDGKRLCLTCCYLRFVDKRRQENTQPER